MEKEAKRIIRWYNNIRFCGCLNFVSKAMFITALIFSFYFSPQMRVISFRLFSLCLLTSIILAIWHYILVKINKRYENTNIQSSYNTKAVYEFTESEIVELLKEDRKIHEYVVSNVEEEYLSIEQTRYTKVIETHFVAWTQKSIATFEKVHEAYLVEGDESILEVFSSNIETLKVLWETFENDECARRIRESIKELRESFKEDYKDALEVKSEME